MPSKVPTIAKIARPGSQGIYPREHLFTKLDQAREKPVLWIAGPAGSGKTSLASSYIESRGIPAIWVQLDEGDGDPAAFFYYLRLAVQNTNHHRVEPLPLFTAEYQQRLGFFTRRFFEKLCDLLKRPYLLVFDNYQEVPEQAVLHEMIVKGLEAVPKDVCVMFLSRSEPPASFLRLVANQAIHLMTWNDLRLSLDESKAIMQMKDDDRPDGCAVEQMHGVCEGWAAGIILMRVLMRVHDLDEWMAIRNASCREIFSYFAGEVLDRLDDDMRSFLLHTAFLPKIQAEAANHLAGVKDAEKRLSSLARNQYFTTRSAGGESVYQYHQLFREFLLATAKEEWTSTTLQCIQRKAAELIENQGHIEDAADLLLDSRDWKGIIRLIQENARSMISQGRYRTVVKWIRRIPEYLREQEPWLWYWLGICRMPEDLQAGRTALQQGYTRFRKSDDVAGVFLSWSGIVETYSYEWGVMYPLDHWIDEMDTLLSLHPRFPSSEIEARVILGMFFALMYRRPDHPDMRRWEEKAWELAFSDADLDLRVAVSSHLIMYYLAWRGHHTKAEMLLNSLKISLLPRSTHISPLHEIVWRSMEGASLWYFNHYEKSHAALEEGIEKAEKYGIPIWNAMLLVLRGSLSLGQKDTNTAKDCIERMAFILNTGRFMDIANYHFSFALLEIIKDRPPQAMAHMETTLRYSRKAGSPTLHHLYLTGFADLLIETGDFQHADEQINKINIFCFDSDNEYLKNYCFWLWARLYFDTGDEPAGFKYLYRYLEHSRKYRIHNHHWWRSSVMARLFVKALNAGIEIDHVQRLIREHDIESDPQYGYVESWPYPIKIRTLGGFQVLMDDKPISFKRKGQTKPLALLKALIAFGGKEIRDELLADALWPDADGESAHKAFTTTLYRLRKMIGHEEAILLKGRRLSLNSAVCRVDVDHLDHCIQETYRFMEPDSEDDRGLKHTAEKIISDYSGHFLEGDPAAWVIGPREVLRSKVLNILMQIGDYWETRRRWDSAVDLYQKTLQTDPLAESACQGLMRCFAHLGRKAEALAAYRRCRMMLSCELKVDPSAETERLRQALESD